MKQKNILLKTNLLICVIILIGFLMTAILSYKANYSASLENIEQVSDLTSEGVYYQMNTTVTKPVNVSLTMANDSLLKELLLREAEQPDNPDYVATIQEYLQTYRHKYKYDSVFLVSAATSRYYNYNGMDRVLEPEDPENTWYYDALLHTDAEYTMEVDNDQVIGAENQITVFVNCKIWDNDGNLIGVVGVGMRIDYLQTLLKSYQDDFDVDVYLIDDAGNIQVSTEYTGYEQVNLFEVEEYGEQEQKSVLDWKEEGTAQSFWTLNNTGQKRDYIVTRYLAEIGWHVVVERDTGLMMEELTRQMVMTVVVIGIIIFIILFVITHVIRSFNRQIVKLTQSVEQARQNLFRTATEQLFENIYEMDITHNCSANRVTEEYFESLGAPPGTPFDQALQIIAKKQIKEEYRKGYLDTFMPENIQQAYEEGRESLSYEFMISQDGQHYYWMRIIARLVRAENDNSLHMLVYRQNIDSEKRQEQKMQMLAQTDEMTGLLTKTATQRRVAQELTEHPEGKYAYFIFDIDNFKQANDLYGHAFGDSVIREFAAFIRGHFQNSDIVGRIGGDEFAAFVSIPDRVCAEEKAKDFCAALHRKHSWHGMNWQMSVSIGVSFVPQDGTDVGTIYEKADAALYVAKKNGKNGYALSGDDGNIS